MTSVPQHGDLIPKRRSTFIEGGAERGCGVCADKTDLYYPRQLSMHMIVLTCSKTKYTGRVFSNKAGVQSRVNTKPRVRCILSQHRNYFSLAGRL